MDLLSLMRLVGALEVRDYKRSYLILTVGAQHD